MSFFTRNLNESVITEGENLEDLNIIKAVLSEFATRLNVNIVVRNPHGIPSEPVNEAGVLHVRFWSCPPQDDTRQTTIEYAYEIELDGGQRDAMHYSYQGIEILDDDGVLVAEYLPGTLYILFDLPHGRNVRRLLTKIMESFTRVYSNDSDSIQRILVENLAKTEERFVAVCQALTGDQKISIQDDLEENDDALRVAQSEIVTFARRRRDLQNRLKAIAEIEKTGDTASFRKQYAELCKISVTGKIKVSSGSIVVPVGQIDIEHNGAVYDIGEFDVIVNTDGRDGGVTCINRTRKTSGGDLYHPHVKSSGSCCLGNISEIIADLVGQADYANVVLVMTDFLKSYEAGGAYIKIEDWPVRSST